MRTDLMLKDESMRVILDSDGEPLTTPDDFYEFYNPVTAKDWVLKHSEGDVFLAIEDSNDMERARMYIALTANKLKRLDCAHDLYLKAGGDDNLRHPIAVFENYTPEKEEGFIVRYFIFKEDNNGTTYRIVDYKQLRL